MIGVNNQARFSLGNLRGENIVALCDINDEYLAGVAKDFPPPRSSTTSASCSNCPASMPWPSARPTIPTRRPRRWRMRPGKHVYCEKPLTHNVYEARSMAKLAAETKLATQMGTQIHAGDNYRRVVEIIRSGAIGPVREVHVWAGKGWGGGDRPTDTPPVPPYLHWDLWLGPRPSGRTSDSTCRPTGGAGGTLAAARWATWPATTWTCRSGPWSCGIRRRSAAEGPPVHPETCPLGLIVRYEFPAAASGRR